MSLPLIRFPRLLSRRRFETNREQSVFTKIANTGIVCV
jgi:hypothetical protein